MPFAPSPGWLHWEKQRTTPQIILPAGAVDAHCHVFGPGDTFPFSPLRKYTPCDASKTDLFELHQELGFARRVVVQATCHGSDNSALLDVLRSDPDASRGVVTLTSDIDESALAEMHELGVRGVRFNFVKRLVDHPPYKELRLIADKIRQFDWHIVIYFEQHDLADLEDFFRELPVPLVIDHMGRPDVSAGTTGADFSRFLSFVDRTDSWVKVGCPERLTLDGPWARPGKQELYTDVAPFARRLIAEQPDRVLWGTDWPHPNLKSHMPDDAAMLNYLAQITDSDSQLHKLLVDNPIDLYWA
ncbi:amidohydrolase family protein [Brevibacterium sp. UCMA 11754]|uniref:amidohydrolase family protein n=1 Tax=Brevibacterium sp. UCMA 11754 TaxID=2749198 RepID=UPI001F39C312|nr:amidohydrolase family protein [Brevibacterium sp. UCMA 11754]MCF2573333.1 amidohydrolase family protein [Brevibacterium sp. UCMA 11754]